MSADQRLERLLRGLEKLADEFEPNYHTHGPMRIRFETDARNRRPYRVVVEAGWDENYGGVVVVEASKTGRSLRVSATDGAKVDSP